MGRKRLTPAERETALKELKAGGTVTGVAAAMGVGRDTVRKVRDNSVRSDRAVTSAAQPIAARVSPAEMQAFDAVIGRAGYRSRSEGVRALIRMSAGFLELSREENAELDGFTAELGKIGVNVNQIARLANSGRLKIVKGGELEALWELHRALRQIRSFLGQMNSERRRRGVALFEASIRETHDVRETHDAREPADG